MQTRPVFPKTEEEESDLEGEYDLTVKPTRNSLTVLQPLDDDSIIPEMRPRVASMSRSKPIIPDQEPVSESHVGASTRYDTDQPQPKKQSVVSNTKSKRQSSLSEEKTTAIAPPKLQDDEYSPKVPRQHKSIASPLKEIDNDQSSFHRKQINNYLEPEPEPVIAVKPLIMPPVIVPKRASQQVHIEAKPAAPEPDSDDDEREIDSDDEDFDVSRLHTTATANRHNDTLSDSDDEDFDFSRTEAQLTQLEAAYKRTHDDDDNQSMNRQAPMMADALIMDQLRSVPHKTAEELEASEAEEVESLRSLLMEDAEQERRSMVGVTDQRNIP